MNAKPGKKLSKGKASNRLPKLNVDAAGIDVGSEEHWVAVPEDRAEHPVRSFKCFTADLQDMEKSQGSSPLLALIFHINKFIYTFFEIYALALFKMELNLLSNLLNFVIHYHDLR